MTGPPAARLDVFPFFVGSGRSGTTLLRAIFDSHPQLAIPDEVSFVIRFARPHYAVRYGWPRRFDADACLALILGNAAFQRWDLPDDDVRAAVRAARPADFPDLIRVLYRLWAAREGKPRYADKTPFHVLQIPRLARMFPEARFVHIIRDGRDVALSYLGVEWGPRTVDEAAVEWRRRVRKGRRAGRRLGPQRYREVRYEQLVTEPDQVVQQLCAFLDLPWDAALLQYHERADEVIRTTRFPAAHQSLLLPPTPGLRDWRRQMAPADVARFEAVAGGLLDELGYERASAPSVRHRLTAGVQTVAATAARSWTMTKAGGRVLSTHLTGQLSGRR